MNILQEVKKGKELEYRKWESHVSRSKDNAFYAVKRMDLLIISICGAGIYLIFQTFKEINTTELNPDNLWAIKLSGIIFLLAISINFISQLTGKESNKNEVKYSSMVLKELEGKKINEEEKNNVDCLASSYNKATRILNISAIVLMFIGLILITYFNYHLLS
ncbi:hypothetical protein GCM10011344_14870 [Dokdonia pacifica]|uniref:Uncharacterized protein n=1 Tax=Dokdonia pacifica TaxID=1627892 RepID=A0A238W3I0_9FLAO|nr:hypothetical protein [Dokdonia pacifica]GGG15296.1 hypothetical protein GCM10011344_14870 [Dokdonia pacifica]SNR41102.1 hypothetical protein SAMN06265376_101657 [Dokdonia pacifica]